MGRRDRGDDDGGVRPSVEQGRVSADPARSSPAIEAVRIGQLSAWEPLR
jgi:hypothetical protein